jgi:hypothetical protein
MEDQKMIKNAKLKNMFKLSSKVTIYIPSTTDINKAIDNKEYIDECASLLSECFGGSTSTPALGYWMSNTAGLVKESTTMVFAYASDSDLQTNIEKVITFCENLKAELKQDAIALEINGEMYFI